MFLLHLNSSAAELTNVAAFIGHVCYYVSITVQKEIAIEQSYCQQMNYGFFAPLPFCPWLICPLACLPPGSFTSWLVRPSANSPLSLDDSPYVE